MIVFQVQGGEWCKPARLVLGIAGAFHLTLLIYITLLLDHPFSDGYACGEC